MLFLEESYLEAQIYHVLHVPKKIMTYSDTPKAGFVPELTLSMPHIYQFIVA